MPSRFEPTGATDMLDDLLDDDGLPKELGLDDEAEDKAELKKDVPPRIAKRDEEQEDSSAESDAIADAVALHCYQTYEESRGAIADETSRWSRFRAMYRGTWYPPTDKSPNKEFVIPRLARICDLMIANLCQRCVPDPYKLDFMQFIAQSAPLQQSTDAAAQYAKLAEYAVRNDLISADWVRTFLRQLFDLVVTGNCYGLAVYETETKWRIRKELNPEYDPEKPRELNYSVNLDGSIQPVDPVRTIMEPVNEYDAPKIRYLNPFNVFPSELDVNDIKECMAVCVYDTVTLEELQEDDIETGGQLYANLDQLSDADQMPYVSETDGAIGDNDDAATDAIAKTDVSANRVRKMPRITYFGALPRGQVFGETEYSEGAWGGFVTKFNIDTSKMRAWRTWVIEIVGDKRVMVRCQPLPYYLDEIPILHCKAFEVTNRLLGLGLYHRCEKDERIYNFFSKAAVEWTTRAIYPAWGFIESFIDKAWRMQNGWTGGRFTYKPDMGIPLANQTARINDAIQPLQFPSMPMEMVYKQMTDRERTMDLETHLPAVKQGAAGGNTATETATMANNADVMLKQLASNIDLSLLKPMLSWILKLHHQYSEANRIVSYRDDSGALQTLQVPPEVWLGEYIINITGGYDLSNKAVRAMNFNEFVKAGMQVNVQNMQAGMPPVFNVQEALKEYGHLLEVRDSDRLIIPTDQIQVIAQKMAEQKVVEILGQMGIQPPGVSPGAEPGAPSGPTPGGAPAPSDTSGRSHHTPGEVEGRQRGLHDQEGMVRRMSQQTRNPENGRAAQSQGRGM